MTTAQRELPASDALEDAVRVRYAGLAAQSGSLSCGGALDVAAPRPGETVVDLGCGRGGDVLRAAARVGPHGLAVGVDANDAMLAAARQRGRGIAHAVFLRNDLTRVSLPGGRVDVVISNCAINHAPDKGAVFREIHRLLRHGGRFAVSDVVAERDLPEAVREDPAAWAACYGGAVIEAEYLGAIAAAGLAYVRVVRRTEPYEKGGVRMLSITVVGRRP